MPAVLCVPADAGDGERTAVKTAAAAGGLNCLRIINEPTAACIAYGLDRCDDNASLVIVVDVGASAARATLIEIEEGIFEVLHSEADARAGGNAVDELIAQQCATSASWLGLAAADKSKLQRGSRWRTLCDAARAAKERLLAADVPDGATETVGVPRGDGAAPHSPS